MENSSSSYSQKLNVNLKHLPPINPAIGFRPPIPGCFEKPRNTRRTPEYLPRNRRQEIKLNGDDGIPAKPVPYDAIEAQNLKTIPAASPVSSDGKNEMNGKQASSGSSTHSSTKEGTPEKGEARTLLFNICTANKWKPPLFECCNEEGPSYAKMFTFKVIIEMKGDSSTVLESYGSPQTRKKVAAQNAAEGALWYLKNLGYFQKK